MKKRYKLIIIIAIVILGIYIIFKIDFLKEMLDTFLIAFIISYALNPLQKAIVRKGVKKEVSAASLLVLLVGIFIIGIIFLIPSIFKESTKISGTIKQIEFYINKINIELHGFTENQTLYNIINMTYSKIDKLIIELFNAIIKSIISLGQYTLEAAVLPVIIYYFLSDYELITNKIILQFPMRYRKITKKIVSDMDQILNRYIVSQVILCILISIATFCVLEFFKINFPIILSIVNGMFNIIPYFGPILGAIPCIAIAFLKSPKDALWVAIVLYIIQQIEGNILSPKITGDSVDMHPIIILILLILGGKVAGVLGMILAVPIGVIIKIIYEDLNYFLF